MAALVAQVVLWGSVARLALAILIGPSVDESYTIVMSRQLSLSYYDHPPMMYWMTRAAAWLGGSEHRVIVRLPFILMFMGSTWLLYRLAAFLFEEKAGLWTSVAVSLPLFFTVSAASWVLPDGPLLFFSAAAAWCLAHAILDPGANARVRFSWWCGFGVCVGLALMSKYHGVFLLVGCGLFLLISPGQRFWLRRPEPYAAGALALLVFMPVLLWNAMHGWGSFRFQFGRAAPLEDVQHPFVNSLIGQAVWITPWVWLPLLILLARALTAGPNQPGRRLLACLAVGPIGFFNLLAAGGSPGLPHWPAPGYFMLMPLLGASLAARLDRQEVGTRWWLRGSFAVLALALVVLVTHTSTGWLARAWPALVSKGDPTRDLIQWSSIPGRLRSWGYPRPGVAIAGDTWVDAAKVAYALGPGTPVYCVGPDARGFEYQEGQQSLVGQDVLLLASRRAGKREPMVVYAPYFEHLTPIGNIPVRRGGEEIEVSVYLGHRLLRTIPQVMSR